MHIPANILNAKILIVDDKEANVQILEYMLADAGYTSVTSTMDSREVLDLYKNNHYDAILLDLNMPYMNGFQVMEALKTVETEGYVPVLVLTAEPDHKLLALQAGAKDFVSKPFDHLEVLTRVQNMLEVRLLYTEAKDYDALTRLPNRMLFQESLKMTLRQAEERHWQVAVLFIDLDHFKNVNDTLGHLIGDELLKQFSQRLVECMHVHDMVGRLGGDDFALTILMPEGQQAAITVADQIRNTLRQPFTLGDHEITMTASIGITVYPNDASDAGTLLKYADTAMYQAKEVGRDTYRFFTAEMNIRAQRRLDIENALRKAIDNNEFVLHYQPKVEINSGYIIGVEALIRWHRPGHGMVSPAEFIFLLEETGLIVRVGAWVIETACKQISEWKRSLGLSVHVSVNVSSRQFLDDNLQSIVVNAITQNNIEPDLLELEITESSLMENIESTITTLNNLKAEGIQISIDDFGTGYSSLAYLKRFPIDTLKIDIAFIRDVTANPDDAAIALAIIRMAHSLKLDVIAEGVETIEQLAYLSRHRCDQIQGFYFSRAVTAQGIEQMIREKKKLVAPSIGSTLPPRTLLIVDDDANVINALKRLLRPDGYLILTASSAAEGFSLLALNEVHIILCDQRMPDMKGTEFLDRIKDMYPDTFRIVLTGYTELASILDTINCGSLYRFYTKPWENTALRENIRAAFRHYWQLHGLVPEEIETVIVQTATIT